MNRRAARKHAFNLTYQIPFGTRSPGDAFMNYMSQLAADKPGIQIPPKQLEYIKGTFCGICAHTEKIDGLIARNLKDWEIDRIGKIDLAILRLCIFEILYDESIPEKVSVNEAVELAKIYGSDESASFVNGVLSGVLKP